MKTIGILGGMSWESTLEYYRLINQLVKEKLGGHHSAKVLMYSFDFDEIKSLQFQDKWDEAGEFLSQQAKKLQDAGADSIVLATNTMHKVSEKIIEKISIPFLHIADGTGERIQKTGYIKVGLLGTAFTMEHDFYKGRLEEKFGLEVIIPNPEERKIVHEVIYNELCLGSIEKTSQKKYIKIIENLKKAGAECVILGCTEICILINAENSPLPIFDTTRIHCEYAVEQSLP